MSSSARSPLPSLVESPKPIAQKATRRSRADPLAAILALGRRQQRSGALLAIAGTLVVHGAPAAQALRTLADVQEFSKHVLDAVRQRLSSEIDLDNQPPPPPPPPPAPEPEPPPPAREAPPPKAAARPEPPPPSPAQASKVLTQEPDPDEPVDLTGEGFVTGTGDRFVGGVTSNTGKSTIPVRQAATKDGIPNGTGAVKAPTPSEDLSRAPVPLITGRWQCGFPSEADVENVNLAYVTLVITVGPDGRARSASVVREEPSGLGFGARARQCALSKPFQAGLDNTGRPTTKTTGPIRIRFER